MSPFERIVLAIGSRAIDLPMIARAGRIAARLAIEFVIAHVVSPRERIDESVVERLKAEARKTNVEWIEELAENPPARLIEIARAVPQTTIALAGTARTPRLLAAAFVRASFTRCRRPRAASYSRAPNRTMRTTEASKLADGARPAPDSTPVR